MLAHGGTGPWKWDVAGAICWIGASAAAYLAGLRAFAGPGRRSARAGARRLGPARVACFAGGLLALAVALLPPLDHLADERVAAHMAQHMILLVVAAPLLAAGAPGLLVPLTLPHRWRRLLARARHALRTLPPSRTLYLPVTAWLLHTGALWIWHLPAAYELALEAEPVHVAEHLCFVAVAWLLWWHVVTPTRHGLAGPVAMLYMFVTMMPAAALGAVLTLARAPLYTSQAAAAAANGLDPLADQQLAGLVMWVPADVVYLVAFVVLFLRWMGTAGHPHQQRAPLKEVRR